MPRFARVKSPEYTYHIMCRSISELDLFKDDADKLYYLALLKKYTDKFQCVLYAYCLMDTHLHLHLDPRGFDISRFMHCVNVSYVIYYNKKYKRHGHLLQGRYESRVVSSDKYALAVSAYIHNNPKDMDKYKGREHEYPFSSMGIYLGFRPDVLGLVHTEFVLGLFNLRSKQDAVKRYVEFVMQHNETDTVNNIMNCISRLLPNSYIDDRRVVCRNIKPDQINAHIAIKLGIPSITYVNMKFRREVSDYRAVSAFIQRALCDFSYKDICGSIGNISMSGVTRLCSKGFKLCSDVQIYKDIFNEIINMTAAG